MSAARVAVTGLGLICPLGSAFHEQVAMLAARAAAGERALRPHPPLAQLPDGGWAGVVGALDLDRFLLRRKDKKLLARPSALALACAGPLVGAYPGDRRELALYLGVGREPPDDGESEATLALSARDGLLDEGLLAGPGRDRYPPLLPLKTLPNMAPAHISINLGLMGENAAWAGVWGAGLLALRAGLRAVAEGRAPAALVGGADSRVDLGSARDRLRVGEEGAPAEGAALLLLEPEAAARDRGAKVYGWLVEGEPGEVGAVDARAVNIDQIGDLGAAAAPVAVALALCGDRPRVVRAADPGLPALAVGVHPDTAC